MHCHASPGVGFSLQAQNSLRIAVLDENRREEEENRDSRGGTVIEAFDQRDAGQPGQAVLSGPVLLS